MSLTAETAGPVASDALPRHWRDLFTEVIDPGLCSGCAACVVACPRQVLGYAGDRPYQTDAESGADGCRFGDKGCTVCAKACVRFHPDMEAMETAVVGRPRLAEETWGVAREVVAVRARDDAVRGAAQDGGLVTALLSWAFDNGHIDGAAVSGLDPDRPLRALPVVVDSTEELLATARSRYTYSPNPLALRNISPSRRVALVGTPCEVSAVRRAQSQGLKKFRSVVFTVGLMCSESFTEDGLLDTVLTRRLGIDLRDVRKVNIKGRVLVSVPPGREGGLRDGTVGDTESRIAEPGLVEIPLKECKPFAREACHWCPDFSGELADISAGGLGLDGWTVAMVRTELGAQWLHGAAADGRIEMRDVEDFPEALATRDRLSRIQRRRPHKMRDGYAGPIGFDGTAVLTLPVPPKPREPAP